MSRTRTHRITLFSPDGFIAASLDSVLSKNWSWRLGPFHSREHNILESISWAHLHDGQFQAYSERFFDSDAGRIILSGERMEKIKALLGVMKSELEFWR